MSEECPAILFDLVSPNIQSYDLDEARGLAKAAGYSLEAVEIQNRAYPHAKYFVGSGKLEEIAETYPEERVVFIVNNRLKASQIANLTDRLHRKVIDRDFLILEIFEKHARTREAKIQVELARISVSKTEMKALIGREMKHERPGRDYHGTGYDMYSKKKRHYSQQERALRERIDDFRVQRANRRRGRQPPVFSLVGYTNSGKTTLLNALAGTELTTRDEVFTTLTTATRRVEIPEKIKNDGYFFYQPRVVLLTDTVGFISDLPQELLNAFVSTLEEIKYSAGILLVHDISDPDDVILRKHRTCLEILHQIGVMSLQIPILNVFNKVDLIPPEEAKAKRPLLPHSIVISAKEDQNLEALRGYFLATACAHDNGAGNEGNLSTKIPKS